jgi:hypothetical protein
MERGSGVCRVTIIIAVLVSPFCTFAQASNPEGASNSASTRMSVCESTDNACAQPNPHYDFVWGFNGTAGTVISPADSQGVELIIESMDREKIVIHRVDHSGATAGRSGTYTGKIQGTHIVGTVQWSWPDHSGFPATGTWSAELQDQPAAPSAAQSTAVAPGQQSSMQGLPHLLLECEGNGPCNAAWTIDGSSGAATWFFQKPVRAQLTVIRSDPDDILIRRTNLTDGNSAVYYGRRQGDTYSGAVVWSSPDHPGTSSGHWSASVPQTTCDASAALSSEDALRIGRNALMFNLQRAAFDCYISAAKAGDAQAQTAVGLIYYQGNNAQVPQNYEQAFFWLSKAASQDSYAAQKKVADMYMLGQGTARSPEMSRFYAEKAAEQKRDMEREQDRQERLQARQEERQDRAADRNAYILTNCVMAAVLGAALF